MPTNLSVLSSINFLIEELAAMWQEMQRKAEDRQNYVKQLPEQNRAAALNLIQYLTFRSYDIRLIQDQLHDLGLSSLASSESHIASQLLSVLSRLNDALGNKYSQPDFPHITREAAENELRLKCHKLFGESDDNLPSVMVTLPTEAAWEQHLVENLLLEGMNIARINLARDDMEIWEGMVDKVNAAQARTGKRCKLYMDIPGPKVRTTGVLGPVSAKGKQKGVELRVGDYLFITSHEYEYRGLQRDSEGGQRVAPVIGCTMPEFLNHARMGDNIYFDDGKFHAIVDETGAGYLKLNILRVPAEKPRLKNDRGINFPDSPNNAPALTAADLDLLPFIVKRADMAGFSFVATAVDIQQLREKMNEITPHPPALIFKIERKQALDNFPWLLLEGLKDSSFGVMIARGDLGIEVGFERLGEIQEEIMWMCEAAHVPVIYATQVLENLNKTGIATRSEISDAALASTADCIMLNKGPYIVQVLRTLHDINRRMQGHVHKKRYTMRPLNIARRFIVG